MGTGVHPLLRLVVLFFCREQFFFLEITVAWIPPTKMTGCSGGTCSMKRPSIDVCRTGWHDIWVNLEGKRWRSCHRIGRFKKG